MDIPLGPEKVAVVERWPYTLVNARQYFAFIQRAYSRSKLKNKRRSSILDLCSCTFTWARIYFEVDV